MSNNNNNNSQKKKVVSGHSCENSLLTWSTTIIAALGLLITVYQVIQAFDTYKGTFIVTALSIPVLETRYETDGTVNEIYKYEIGVRINNKGNTPFTLINVIPYLADKTTGKFDLNNPLTVDERFKQIQIKGHQSEVFETFAWINKDELKENSTLNLVLYPMVLNADDKLMAAKYPLTIQVGEKSESIIAGQSQAVDFVEDNLNKYMIGIAYYLKKR